MWAIKIPSMAYFFTLSNEITHTRKLLFLTFHAGIKNLQMVSYISWNASFSYNFFFKVFWVAKNGANW